MNGEHGNGKPTPPPSSPGRQGDERQGLIRPPAPSSGEPEATLRTPTRELHPEPLVAHPTPSVEETNTLIEQRLPALGKKPKATEIALRKKTGVRKPFLSRANELGIKIGGRTQKGLAPTDTSMTVAPKRRAVPGQAVLPDAVNYAGQRTAQVLSQLSEIIKAAAKQNGMTPVEVQIGVAELPDGTRTVYISANDHESQLWMREALANPRQIFKDAVASGDGHVRRNIAKLLSPEKTRAERLGRAIENPNMPENTLDMSRAEAVAQMVFKGDVTVVVNKYGRHAEQNIYSAITARKNYTHLEIEGSLMRCAACGGVIGHNVKLDGVRVSGRFHVSQESEHQAAADLHGIRDGSLRVLDQHAPSNRRPSHSAPPDLGKNDPLPPMRDRLPPADLFDLLGEKPPTQNEAGESMATTAQGPKARVAEPEAASPLRVRIAVECSEEEAAIIEAESTAEAICEEDVKRRRQ